MGIVAWILFLLEWILIGLVWQRVFVALGLRFEERGADRAGAPTVPARDPTRIPSGSSGSSAARAPVFPQGS